MVKLSKISAAQKIANRQSKMAAQGNIAISSNKPVETMQDLMTESNEPIGSNNKS
jgi:hypothetical protein